MTASDVKLPDMTGISKRQAKRLLKLLAALHEKAYRRGFQHGHGMASGSWLPHEPPPTPQQVTEWRMRGYDDAEPPPHGGHHKRKKAHAGTTNVDRMMIEAVGDMARWLRELESIAKPTEAKS